MPIRDVGSGFLGRGTIPIGRTGQLVGLGLLTGAIFVGLALFLVWFFAFRDDSDPITVQAAVAAFREEQAARATGSSGIPEPGVYVYQTTGYETADALLGARHDYPELTTITVLHTGCGLRMRWDALEGRSSTWEFCETAEGRQLESLTDIHEFFNQIDARVYACGPETMARPATIEIGATWTTHCSTDSTIETATLTVVGTETVAVEGTRVETARIREETVQSGLTDGMGLREWWLDVRTGLVLRQIVRNDSTTSTSIGSVTYHEEYELILRSLEPRR